jgi:exodeoxyribonuclease VII large subunit
MPNDQATAPNSMLSVSELNGIAAELLQTQLDRVWVTGELSNVVKAQSGHLYCTLKDKNAQIRCAFFKSRQKAQHKKLAHGQAVIAYGQVGLYQARGDYQLIIHSMEEAGAGSLQRAYEMLKKELAPLFEAKHKQTLPTMPRAIGIISSIKGAALHDMLSVTQRRFPSIPIIIYPTLVQGKAAAKHIAHTIKNANIRAEVDVLILARGGGSLEDLWAFNEAIVAHAIFDSRLPIITGVGHETDTTIADLVADMRAPTPSVAAERCTPLASHWLEKLRILQAYLQQHTQYQMTAKQQQLTGLTARIKHPQSTIDQQSQRLDHLQQRLHHCITKKSNDGLMQLQHLQKRLTGRLLIQHINQQKQQLKYLSQQLQRNIHKTIDQAKNQLKIASGILQAASPLNTLSRGYSVLYDQNNTVVRHSKQIKTGDTVTVQLHRDQIKCAVLAIHQNKAPKDKP